VYISNIKHPDNGKHYKRKRTVDRKFNGVHTRQKLWAQINTLSSEINDKRRDGAAVSQN